MSFIAYLNKNRWPLLAVAGGAVMALAGFRPRVEPSLAPEVLPVSDVRSEPAPASVGDWDPTSIPPMPSDQAEVAPGSSVSGEVLEQIDVDKYSYLRLGEKGTAGTWAAVPVTFSRVGQRVAVTSAQLMTQFASATLKRTFDAIYFGVLDSPSDVSHASSVVSSGNMEQPHPGPGPAADAVPVGHLQRAKGGLGMTVAELNAAGPEFANKKARVHAMVVKSTSGVIGRTFLHVRDGSGEVKRGTNDLAVTSASEFPVGKDVVLEGSVSLDTDFGSGYRYHVLLTDAVLIQE